MSDLKVEVGGCWHSFDVVSTVDDSYRLTIIKKKIYCFFLAFVLFILAHQGFIPIMKRDARNDEVPYGFG